MASDVAVQMVRLWDEARSLARRVAALPEPYRTVVTYAFLAGLKAPPADNQTVPEGGR